MNRLNLEPILGKVEKPSRYIGNEVNSIHKNLDNVNVRFGFCFPDIYEVAMSHLGMHILYGLLNSIEDVYCERVFAPWIDMEEKMRETAIPLFGLESRQAVTNFDFLGFTLQYEMSYTNIINMIDLAGIPILQKDRKEEHPFIIVGGPCAYNCEPLAEIVDFAILGESEEILPELIDIYREGKKNNKNKAWFLEEICNIDGVYVPSFYQVVYGEDNKISTINPIINKAPRKVSKRIVKDLDNAYYPESIIVPYINVVHERVMLEVFRGCTRGCRFCQAGMLYRPIREKMPQTLKVQGDKLLKSTGYEEVSLASLSTSDYSQLPQLTDQLIEDYTPRKIGLSLPSLRLDSFSVELAQKIQQVRKSGLTFAPEAGTQRLRDVINKGVTEKDLLDTVYSAFSNGWSTIKLYFMIGLPTETMEDIDGIADLAYKVLDCYYSIPKEKRAKGLKITVSTSTFVPKPFTPFQWEPQITQDEVIQRQRHLKTRLKHKNIVYNWHQSEVSWIEGVFALGDRRLSEVLIEAWKLGCKFDGWAEYFDYDKWSSAFAKANVSPEYYTYRKKGYDEILPWDHIDPGVTKKFLIKEHEKAMDAVVTADCRVSCTGCGLMNSCGIGIGGE